MGVWNRALAALLATLLASASPPSASPSASPSGVHDVTTHGGGPDRSNWYTWQSPPWLCFDWSSTTEGKSYTQPLMVRDNVYHLNGNKLYRRDIQGRQIGAIVFKERGADGRLTASKGQLTYHIGPSPAEDLLFVPTPGPPYGLAVVRPYQMIGEIPFSDAPLWTSPNGSNVVTAPLYFPELGAVVLGTAAGADGDHIWLISTTGDSPDVQFPPKGSAGWISGSPVQVGPDQFVIGVAKGLRRLTITSGVLNSTEQDLLKTIPAPPNSEILSAVAGGGRDTDGFGTIVYVIDKLGNLYKINTTTGPILIDDWADLSPHPHVQGFNNSGPAVDDKYVYLPIRWPLPDDFSGNASVPDRKPWYGSMTSFEKMTGAQAWSQELKASDTTASAAKPSWVNQEPIVYGGGRNADQSPKPRVVLAGDAGGRVWAWDGEGNPMPFALVDDQQVPMSCDSLEGPDAPGTVHYSAVAALTDRPHVVDGWSPESGVAIGLMFARDRLLTGVNEKNGAGEVQSRLVALRSGTNAWIQWMTFSQNGEDRAPERLNPREKATVKVTAAWSVTGAGRTLAELPVYAGWSDQHIDSGQLKRITPTGPLGQQTLEFELPARTGAGQGTVAAVVNPGLLMRRQPKEEGAVPIPDLWRTDFAETAADANLVNRGEVLVGDNLVTQAVGGSSPPVAQLWVAPTEACTGQEIKYNTSYWDPQHLPIGNQEGQPIGWPPPARFDKPATLNIRYRAQNTAGAWTEWAEKTLTVKDCTKPPPASPSIAFDVAFDPAIGHRGHRINMDVTVQRKAEIDARKITAFHIDKVTVTLPDELRNLRACVPYQPQCWEAPNDPGATGSDLDWHYSFDLPAPGTTPEDGAYTVTVTANGTYTWDHWHENWHWHAHLVPICNPDPVTGQETCQQVDHGKWVDEGEKHMHTETWSASQQVTFTVTGGHQFVHPATDHD